MKKILLLSVLVTQLFYAQKPAFDPENSKGKLYEYTSYTNVGDSDYSINEILTNDLLNYEDLKSENHDFSFTTDTYWIDFSLKNSSHIQKKYYLETARPITDVVDLYQIGEEIKVQKNGDQIPFKERTVQNRQIVFEIVLPPASEQQFFIKLVSDGETTNLPLNLYEEITFLNASYKQQLFLGLFYGVLLLAGLIYLFFFTSLNNKAFLYYGLYVFSIALMQASLDGLIHQYFLPNGGYINSRMVLISALFSNFFLLKYCQYFLNVNLHLPKFVKFYNIIYGVIFILFTMLFVSPKTLELTYPISNLNGLFSLILILTSGFTMRYRKISIDPYFSIGIFFLIVGLLGFVMNNLGLLPSNFYTLNSSKFGTGFEVVFLSLSMTNLIKKLREQKEKSQETALQKSQEANSLKTYFMSNMSHELRTPINAIMGIVESEIASSESSKPEREKYQIIKNAIVSLLSNVNDILDFEKIEKKEITLKNETFNPSIVLNQICENWKSEAINKGLSFNFEMDAEIPIKVIGDSDRMLQVINNALSNAVKFTNSGSVNFMLKCLKQPNNNSKFSFRISDTGIGMNQEEKDNVFDSFNQMRLNHKRKFGGIGLGLTIAKYLVDLFDGSIKVESEPNQGTNVFIEIPLEIANKNVKGYSEETDIKGKPAHILVVEDNKINQMVILKFLKSFPNTTFAVVENGKEAIEALKENVYDLVLMDLQMPVMDGYEATELIRSGSLGEAISNIPIIAVTADALEETRKHVLNIGMNDYMTKPVNRDLLLNKIKNHTYRNLEVVA